MNKIFKYTLPAILVGLVIAGATNAQVVNNLLKKVGSNLLPQSTSTTIGSSTVNGAFKNLTISGTCTNCGGSSSGGVSTSTANTWTQLQTINQLTSGSSTFTSPSGTVLIGNNQTASLINVVPSTTISASVNSGGAINEDNTKNAGTGTALTTSFGAGALGRLLNAICNNAAFDQECAGITNFSSSTSALGVIGNNLTNKGVVKATHNQVVDGSNNPTDANASVYSADIKGTSTAAMGLFITDSNGWTIGRLITARNGTNTPEFAVGPYGDTGIGTESPRGRVEIQGLPSASSSATDYFDISSSTQGDILAITSSSITTSLSQNLTSQRWMIPYFTGLATTNATTAATSSVFLLETPITQRCVANSINIDEGSPSDATDIVYLGIYGMVTSTSDTASGTALLAQGTTTFSTTNTGLTVNLISPTTLSPGIVYIGAKFSSSSINYLRQANGNQVTGWGQTYADGSTTSLPSTIVNSGLVNTGTSMPAVRIHCSSN